MHIMIIDNEEVAANMLASKVKPLGHTVSLEPDKEKALQRAVVEPVDVFLMDPAPLSSARSFILNLRRSVGSYPYIFAFSSEISPEEAIKSGANDIFPKPLDPEALIDKLEHASYLTRLIRRIGDDSEDFPSAGGVIAKSAFNQLFLSALERADRYGERSYILFISVSNYAEIVSLDGAYGGDYAVAKLSQDLVRLRRQSDIIGQTEKYEYALLLQRPGYESEPIEAANRFADNLSNADNISSSGTAPVEITVSLVELPSGCVVKEHVFSGDQPAV